MQAMRLQLEADFGMGEAIRNSLRLRPASSKMVL